MVNILVCVKRVPETGARITLNEDQQLIDTNFLGFTISPHEECAVEEAVQQVEKLGGQSTVMTLGLNNSVEQLRTALSMGINEAVLIETDVPDWPPIPTSQMLARRIKTQMDDSEPFDLLFFGNESSDSGGYQVGIRVAHALGLPCLTGVKGLEIKNGKAIARREAFGGWEEYEVDLPAVIIIKEGINLPRYPSMRGKLAAKKKEITIVPGSPSDGGLEKIRLNTPVTEKKTAVILGHGPEAAPKVAALLKELKVVKS